MFTNTSIKFRLIFVMSVLSALVLGIGAMGLYGFSQSNAGIKTIYEDRLGPAVQLGTILDNWYQVQAKVVAATNLSNPDAVKTLSAEVQQLVQKNEGLWVQFQASNLIPEEKSWVK